MLTFDFPAGDLCAAKFSDGEWYRAKVEKVAGSQVMLFFKKRVDELNSNFLLQFY
jgi:hypothetical protein